MTNQLFFEDLEVGDSLPETIEETSHVQLFRYSGVTWNGHRIHYDKTYAASEGYPDVLVHSHLHGAFLTKFCVAVAGQEGVVEEIDLAIKKYAIPGDTLTCRGRVTGKEECDDSSGRIFVEFEEVRNSDGAVCAPGTARIVLPRRTVTLAEGQR
jgi:acyl dehydratase